MGPSNMFLLRPIMLGVEVYHAAGGIKRISAIRCAEHGCQ